MSSTARGGLYAALTIAIWTSFVLLSRTAGEHHISSFDLTALRFGIAAIILLPAWLLWLKSEILFGRMVLLAAIGGLAYSLLVYSAFKFAPAAHGGILLSGTLPFWVTLHAALILKERPNRTRLLGLGFVLCGVALLAAHSFDDISHTWPGDLLLISGAMVWGLYTVLVKRWQVDPIATTLGVGLWSAALFLPVYFLLLPKDLTVVPWQELALQGVFHGVFVVIIATWLYMEAMKTLGPTRLGAVMALVPATSGLAAVLVLGEPFSWLLAAGMIASTTGAFIAARS